MSADTNRLALTARTRSVLARLQGEHGALMFHVSGGCCDGSAPMCYPRGEFLTGPRDVLLGSPVLEAGDAVPVWMSGEQFEYWRHTHLTIDTVEGRGAGFSLEAPLGVRFLLRSRLLTDAEAAGAA
jgi:uncharacterized protein (DUF779 family)